MWWILAAYMIMAAAVVLAAVIQASRVSRMIESTNTHAAEEVEKRGALKERAQVERANCVNPSLLGVETSAIVAK